jgi:hypothetical protein
MASPSKAERPATYEDANLLLRLYELRREDKMRQARDWFNKNFHANNLEELSKICPLGSQEHAYFRMVSSYWDMAASFVTSGVLQRELFRAEFSRNAVCLDQDVRRRARHARGAKKPGDRQKFRDPGQRHDRAGKTARLVRGVPQHGARRAAVSLFFSPDRPNGNDVDLKRVYDAVIVGSGAAGGMAAHVLTSHGMKVLLLEAGKKLNINKAEVHGWPYEHPRRGDVSA